MRARACVLALAVAGALLAAGAAPGYEPTPTGPVFGGVPGALPKSVLSTDVGGYRGWPVRPLDAEHPIRGSFLDPRGNDDDGLSGYHFGIDVNVDDALPDAGAPAGMSHAVYALASGVVSTPRRVMSRRCVNRRLDVGRFSYWHVSPLYPAGRRIRAGEQIGWTCQGVWHVHVSEWLRVAGVRVWVNPLRPGGALAPYVDTAAPVVSALRYFGPPKQPWLPTKSLATPDSSPPLPATALRGRVEVRAQIGDPQSFLGFLARDPAWPTRFSPYRVAIRIVDAHGKTILGRVSFEADQLPQTPYLVHYAPGTVEPDNMQECVGPPALRHCDGSYWFRPLSRFRQKLWDTRTVANGDYRVTVRGWDVAGNVGARTETVTVRN